MATRRIFVAIDLSEAARTECVRHMDTLQRSFPNVQVGWERPEKLHITLKFLGDTDENTLANLQSAIGDIAARVEPFKLRLAGPGVFPSRHRARILWVGIADLARVIEPLQDKVEAACLDLGAQNESRDYAPHVTIGRIRKLNPMLVGEHLAGPIEPVEFDVSEIVIYESQRRASGSVYGQVSGFQLKPSKDMT